MATDLWVHLLTALHEMMDVKAPRSVVSQGGIYRWMDGRTVPDVQSALYEYDGFIVDMYANLANARGNGDSIAVMGTGGTLTFGGRAADKVIVQFDPAAPAAAWYGLNGWPKAHKEKYLASVGLPPTAQPEWPQPKPNDEFAIPRGLEHHEYFRPVIARKPAKQGKRRRRPLRRRGGGPGQSRLPARPTNELGLGSRQTQRSLT